ncbi:TerD family protein [Nocardia asteroides]|uniref:TerD family protein n=1 Tax=Nocardia asteroides TaxID=1824 RepID=UPI001E5FCC6D|nr:TerD family protein [Nocardia asteroides]UGT63980.1 TerD family protein [Nocardia asteroides]
MKLSRGGNAPVPADTVVVALGWRGGEVDPQALLVDTSGRIRTDDDFVFYNAPKHPSGAVTLREATGDAAALEVALPKVEPSVERIVITGSVDTGSFRDIAGLTVEVRATGAPAFDLDLDQTENVSAVIFGEFYRRGGGWKFRNVTQGWDSGLRGLAKEFGVGIDDDEPVPPGEAPAPAAPSGVPAPAPAPTAPPAVAPDWYTDAQDPSRVRWWDGVRWADETRPIVPVAPGVCGRCGRATRIPRFGAPPPCRWCENDVSGFLDMWRSQVWQVLTATGPQGPAWEDLWVALRFQRIDPATGSTAMRPLAVAHLERVVTFAFADDEIDEHEMTGFDAAVTALRSCCDLSSAGSHIEQLRQRMLRGRSLTQVRAGELPRIQRQGLHLSADEIVHVDVAATQVRYLASGPRQQSGRLIGSNRKLRFVGTGPGTETPWEKIVSVGYEYGSVVIAASTARGGGTYRVPDPDYVAAVLEGALRVAKRLVLAPGRRDTRTIPQHMKSEVWQRDGGRCVECGAGHYLEFDHVIPLSRGGATSVSNLQVLCRGCNLAKGARI